MNSALSDVIFWLAVACCVVAQAAILRSALVAPVRPHDEAIPRPRRAVEVVWVVLPALALALVLALTWRAMHRPARTDLTRPAPVTALGGGLR